MHHEAVAIINNRISLCSHHRFHFPRFITIFDFLGILDLDSEMLKFHDFPGFHDPCEPSSLVSIFQFQLNLLIKLTDWFFCLSAGSFFGDEREE